MPKTLFGEKYVALVVPERPVAATTSRPGATIERTAGRHRGREGAQRPLPAAARRPAGRDQPDPQRDRHRARGPRRADRREPRDRRRLPQAAQPADPGHRRGPPADGQGVQHLRRRDARRSPQILRNTIKTTGTLEDREAAAATRSSPTCRRSPTTPASFLDAERRQHHPARPARRRPAAGAREVRAGVPLPDRRASSTPASCRPRRSAASRCTSCSRRCPTSRAATTPSDVPRLGDDRGPDCLHLPNPPWSQANPLRHQPDFDDGVDSPTGKGTSRVAPGFGDFGGAGLRRRPRGGRPAQVPARPRPRADRRPRCPTSASCWSGPMARGAEVSLR